jgi:23S rRNA pseudouridine1911/1915/1917 synthase
MAREDEPPTAQAPAGPAGAGAGDPPFTIAFQDEHLIVVDKGPGVVVHPSRGHREDTLAQLLAPLLGGSVGEEEQRRGVVHRLDRDTSGLLVLARSDEALRRLQAALADRRIEREYLARVRTRMAVGGAAAREARTHFTLERALGDFSLLRLRLETGRTHQIRVHLRAIGHPVCGDPEYGTPGLLGLERQFLHATRLAFEHPLTGQPVEVSSPLPADLRAALGRAGTPGGAGGRVS